MRFGEPLDELVGSKTRVRLLRLFAKFPGKEFTGREAASLVGGSPSQVGAGLYLLLRHGAVLRRTAGNVHLWSAVADHFAFRALRGAFALERSVPTDLRRTLVRALALRGVRKVVLFGSVARGEEGPDSDIDVLVVVGSGKAKADVEQAAARAARSLKARFGNTLSVFVYGPAEARKADARRLLERAEREGEVLHHGSRPEREA